MAAKSTTTITTELSDALFFFKCLDKMSNAVKTLPADDQPKFTAQLNDYRKQVIENADADVVKQAFLDQITPPAPTTNT